MRRAQQGLDLLARPFDLAADRGAEGVHRRRVAEMLGEKRQHFRQHVGIDPGGGVVVEINPVVRNGHRRFLPLARMGRHEGRGLDPHELPSFSTSFICTPIIVPADCEQPEQAPVSRT